MHAAEHTCRSPDGTGIVCYTHGASGPPVVFVHGSSLDHASWDPVLPFLTPHIRVVAIERRGRGGSGDASRYGLECEFADVAAVADQFKRPIDVVAHSFGALCTLGAALESDCIRRLVLYEPLLPGTANYWPVELSDQMLPLLRAGQDEAALLVFLQARFKLPQADIDAARALPSWPSRVRLAHTIAREMRALDEYRFEIERLSGVRSSVTFLEGEVSPPLRNQVHGTLMAALPSARLIRLPGQGHLAVRTAPELFARAVMVGLHG